MRIGSLFSGVGGLELGLEAVGLGDVAWQAERDPFCRSVLRRHWPSVKRYNDVREVRRGQAEAVDLICGGFPCQPVSVAGHGLGADDERWLWPECLRITAELEPQWCVWENVPMLRQRGLCGVLADVAALGLNAEWFPLRASDAGAPHRRERLFIVTHRDGSRLDRFRRAINGAHAEECDLDEDCSCPMADRHGDGFLELGAAWVHADGAQRDNPSRRCAYPPRRGDDEGWAGWTGPEPLVRRGADGLSDRLDRIHALGNAVVPGVAQMIGRAIKEASQ